jgi:glycerophosphoryl diester phosphodiesterase
MKAPRLHGAAGLDIAAIVLEVLAQKGYADKPQQVFLQCFDGPTLQRLRHELKTALPLIQLIGENSWGEDTDSDYDYLRSPSGLAEIAGYAHGIGPWVSQIYLGRDPTGKPHLSELVKRAQALGLLVHPYTFRRDDLPAGIDNFEELLDILFLQAGVNGVFTDFPDIVRQYLHSVTR